MFNKLLITLTAVFTLAFAGIASADTTPQAAVQGSVDTILSILRDDSLDHAGKREKMRGTINERFDFRAMSQRTLATNWKKLSDEEKQKFTDLFSRLIENSYVGKLEAYTDEKVEYPGEKVKGKKATVNTLIITSSTEIPVNYKLYRKGSDWLVYDVIIEGVSLISNYRSTYQEIYKKDGFDGLMARMQDKINELEFEPTEQPA